MRSDVKPSEDPRILQALDVIYQLAAGNLEARGAPSDRGDDLDAIIVGVNMLAEEFSALQQETRRQAERLAALNEIARAIGSSLQIDDVFGILADSVGRLIPFERASVALLEEDGETMTVFALHGAAWSELAPGLRLPVTPSTRTVAATRRGVLIPDLVLEVDDPTHQRLLREGIWAAMAAPLVAGDRVIGVLNLGAREPGTFGGEHLSLLQTVADQIAPAVENARLHKQLQHHAEELERRVEERTAALRASEEHFRRAVLDSPFPIMLHAEDGAVLLVSNSWYEISGYSPEELATIGDWTERAYGERRALVQAHIDRLYNLDHRVADGDYAIRTRSGETRIWAFNSAPLGRLPDGRRLVISMAMDVTEQRKAEAEVRELNKTLERRIAERTTQLQAANQELEAFAYSVSHDLRAPLRAMDGFSAALISQYQAQLDEQGRHYLERIQTASQRMGQLIDDLLNLSRVSRAEFSIQPVNLSALAREIAAELRARQPQRQADILVAEQLEVQGDASLLRVALQNLLDNAWKFTAPRPQARIEVGVREQSDGRVYFVRDNGVGFNMAYADKLFTPFQRLHTVREFPGTGIGLVTVQRIIHRHGGRVWAQAVLDQGTTFYFTLGDANE